MKPHSFRFPVNQDARKVQRGVRTRTANISKLSTDPTLWVALLLLGLITAGGIYLSSYEKVYPQGEYTLAWASPTYPVAVLHTEDAAYVLGGGTLTGRIDGLKVITRPWGAFVTPIGGGRGRMSVVHISGPAPPWHKIESSP